MRQLSLFKYPLSLLLVLATVFSMPYAVWAQEEVVDQPVTEAETAESDAEAAADSETETEGDEKKGLQARLNELFATYVNGPLGSILFFPVYTSTVTTESGEEVAADLPFIVLVLVLGGIFFTFRFGFINVRLFRHSIQVIRGKFDKEEDTGEISHFQALTSALSATVGLGNIAGVALAISMGGPGAVFWMWVTAFFGMSMKFSSCTLAQLYRRVGEDGRVQGGPMIYLEDGIKDVAPSLAPLGKFFAVFFAVLMVCSAFGAGNMFQANQTASIVTLMFFDGEESMAVNLGLGIIMAFMAGIVLIGGIKRIGETTSKLVPLMCVFYCTVCLIIILMNVGEVPAMFANIFSNAFSPDAAFGGFVGVLVMGMRRAAFSNEAGLGSAAIAHAAAKTDEPVREGVVAMIGPFIDTLVICTMTALTILITGAHLNTDGLVDVQITARAFEQLGGAVPYILCLAVFIFAYSTMISWGYYAERCVEYLVGMKGIMIFRLCYVFAIVVAPVLTINEMLNFADILLLTLAFPNIIGMAIISSKLKPLVEDYCHRLATGEMKQTK